MTQWRVIELVRVLFRNFLINHANTQPVTRVLVNLEGHCAARWAFIHRWLQQTEMVIVGFWGLDDFVRYQSDPSVFELGAELEFHFGVENWRVGWNILQGLDVPLQLLFHFLWFLLPVSFQLLLNPLHSLLNIFPAQIITVSLILIHGHASQ